MNGLAQIEIRSTPHYRRDAFESGLVATGYKVVRQIKDPTPNDVLVTWNRYGRCEQEATRFERCGARVLVTENGYLGHDETGRQYYAIARSQHNGAGTWEVQGERWIHGVELQSWREGGTEVVVLAQRGIGSPSCAQPRRWLDKMSASFRVRPHPGRLRNSIPLEDDLERAAAVVTWGSAAGLEAICMGIPCFYGLPQWIGAPAAAKFPGRHIRVDDRVRAGRGEMLRRIAWAQWRVDEIKSGKPFEVLL